MAKHMFAGARRVASTTSQWHDVLALVLRDYCHRLLTTVHRDYGLDRHFRPARVAHSVRAVSPLTLCWKNDCLMGVDQSTLTSQMLARWLDSQNRVEARVVRPSMSTSRLDCETTDWPKTDETEIPRLDPNPSYSRSSVQIVLCSMHYTYFGIVAFTYAIFCTANHYPSSANAREVILPTPTMI